MKEITVTLKEKVDFSKAKIRDDVFCIRKGAGKIVQIAKGTYYSVHVLFNTGEENSYLFTGRDIMTDIYAALYFFNPDTQEVLYERPEPEIDWSAYKEKMIEVSDDGSIWYKRELFEYNPKFERKFFCWGASDGTISIHLWKQARLIKENS